MKISITILLLISSFRGYSQVTTLVNDSVIRNITGKDTAYISKPIIDGIKAAGYVEQDWSPHFKGNVKEFIKKNLTYPADAKALHKQGTVRVYAQIWETGVLTNVILLSYVYPSIDSEAIRIVKLMKNWSPAMINGKAYSAYTEVDIPFILDGEDGKK